jgi:His/Glu/Gln/Arg/opine family amino acid ABC transporter permease subunit
MHRPYGVLTVLLLLLLALSGCNREEGTLAHIRRSKELVIGTDATYPPFESTEGGEFKGFDIELGNAIGEELGAKVRWANTAFDGIFPALLARKFDLVMSSVTITDERKRQLAFSDPYYEAGQIVAVRGTDDKTHGLDNLNGKEVGIQINTTAEQPLKERTGIKVRRYDQIDQALQDLANGNIAAVVGDAPTLRYMIKRGFPQLKTIGDLLTQEHYGVVMRPQEKDLQAAVNGALAKLRSDGRFAKLEEKWFGQNADADVGTGPRTVPWGRIVQALLFGIGLTIQLTLIAVLLGMPIGLVAALCRQVRFAPVRWLFTGYVELLRGTPLLVQIIFVYYALPQLAHINLPPFVAAVWALSLNSGAYISEIFRAGIQSIDSGQMEAARSLGMTYGLALRTVVLPQAFRRVLPPLTNEAIAMLKDTSLVSTIGMVELTRAGQQLSSSLALPLAVWPLVALFYLAVTFPLTRLAAWLEAKWTVKR